MWILSADIVLSQTQAPEQMAATTDAARFPMTSPYRTQDGRYIQLMLLDPERYWAPLCHMLGCEKLLQDPRFTTVAGRTENGVVLVAEFGAAIGAKPWSHWQPIFEAWDAPWELVKTIHEVAADPQAAANGQIFEVEVQDGTRIKLASGPVGFDGQFAPIDPRRAPLLGEHTDEIMESLGIAGAELERLRASSVVQ
jgi:crotonobetainyl-CoA:carnitine CoA-transferase CaiB-like acyl-CoA transferase